MTVADEWQRQGVGTAILSLLAERARKAGIETFHAICLAGNADMRQLLEDLGPVAKTSPAERGVVAIETRLPTGRASHDALAPTLLVAARGHDQARLLRARQDG